MVAIIFADLSVTLDIKHIRVGADESLRSVIDKLTNEWMIEEITVRGCPVSADKLSCTVEGLSRINRYTGELVLEIEKH